MTQESRRLDSWKEIADYLGRDVRTAIRWEKEKGLPVHRLPGGKRAGVYAHAAEIDGWLVGQGEPIAAPPANMVAGQDDPVEPPTPLPRSGSWPLSPRRLAVPAIGFLVLAAALVFIPDWNTSETAGPPRLVRPLNFSRVDYAASIPLSVVSGDFNGDGKVDLAFTNHAENVVVALLGDGFGTFAAPIATPAGKGPERLAVADFDNDGNPDLAVTHKGSKDLQILLGDGRGGFRQGFHFDTGGRSRWVSAADFNSDGHIDLVVACSEAGRLVVLVGNGDGTFRLGGDYPAEKDISSLAVGDFNRDGLLDVVTSDYRSGLGDTVSFYPGNGDGTFGSHLTSPTGVGPLGMASADLNGDGIPDLVTADFQDSVSVLLGKGNGTFTRRQTLQAGMANGFSLLTDFDRDGNLDLVVLGEHSDDLSLFAGRGDGTFEARQPVSTGQYPDAGVIADFDNDGRPDLAVANVYGNSVSVLLNRSEWAAPDRTWVARLLKSFSRRRS